MFARSEVETTLSFVLPLDVATGALFDDFCRVQSVNREALEVFTYRITRIGNVQWRVGSKRVLRVLPPALSINRLALLRYLSSCAAAELAPEQICSELKIIMGVYKTPLYDDAITLYDNTRYPLILEDSVSCEFDRLDERVERSLLRAEHDTSDSNLGLCFVRRVSWYVSTVVEDDDFLVRCSLRSVLNEHHEISYQIELECEQRENDSVCDGDRHQQRARRHVAVLRVYRERVLPLLRLHWPDGLRLYGSGCAPSRDGYAENFFHDLSEHQRECTMRTGRSLVPRESFDSTDRNAVATLLANDVCARLYRDTCHSATDNCAAVIKVKYDGARTFATYADGALHCDSNVLLVDGPLSDVLCGLYVYQVERVDHRERGDDNSDDIAHRTQAVLTEVAFLIDHKVAQSHGGASVLADRFGHTVHVASPEQQTSQTAYLLPPPGNDDDDDDDDDDEPPLDLWPLIEYAFERSDTARCFVRFVESIVSNGRHSDIGGRRSYRRFYSSIGTRDDEAARVDSVPTAKDRSKTISSLDEIARALFSAGNVIAQYLVVTEGALQLCAHWWPSLVATVREQVSRPTDRLYLPVSLDFSHRALSSIGAHLDAFGAKDESSRRRDIAVCVSRPIVLMYPLPPRELVRAALRAMWLREARVADGFLLLTNSRYHSRVDINGRVVATYTKIKLRQSVELALVSANTLEARGHTLAVRVNEHQWLLRESVDRSGGANVGRQRRPQRGLLTVLNLPRRFPRHSLYASSSTSPRIAEFEFVTVGVLRFTRWRLDKDRPDRIAKALAIVHNRGE